MKNMLSELDAAKFSKEIDGKPTALYTLRNDKGLEIAVTNYGAKIVSLVVPDKNGQPTDVVLGHDSIDDYLASEEAYFGAVCGRYGNRIAKGTFTLDGITYDKLAINNGPNSLHGGIKGFNAVVWDAEQPDERTLKLTYLSADGEEGFPGALATTVVYRVTDKNELIISYEATTDKPTVLNLTNHSYFNLSGAGDPSVADHILEIQADSYLPTDETAIPYGKPEPVAGTPMDFRTPHRVGERIDEPFQQLIWARGYDHTYILNKQAGELSFCARCSSPKTGIVMETYTTQPGVQLYTGNWMTGHMRGKFDQRYPARAALCLETQHFPDSPNKPEYPTTVLRPGETYEQTTIYQFDTIG